MYARINISFDFRFEWLLAATGWCLLLLRLMMMMTSCTSLIYANLEFWCRRHNGAHTWNKLRLSILINNYPVIVRCSFRCCSQCAVTADGMCRLCVWWCCAKNDEPLSFISDKTLWLQLNSVCEFVTPLIKINNKINELLIMCLLHIHSSEIRHTVWLTSVYKRLNIPPSSSSSAYGELFQSINCCICGGVCKETSTKNSCIVPAGGQFYDMRQNEWKIIRFCCANRNSDSQSVLTATSSKVLRPK